MTTRNLSKQFLDIRQATKGERKESNANVEDDGSLLKVMPLNF